MILAILVAMPPSIAAGRGQVHQPAELLGVWRGTSTCTDRVVAPACRDEVVVYEFTAGDKVGVVHWKADKIVNGQRESMGDFDLTYNTEGCWYAEFSSPRVHDAWCLMVNGTHLSGKLWDLPGKRQVRKIDADKGGV